MQNEAKGPRSEEDHSMAPMKKNNRNGTDGKRDSNDDQIARLQSFDAMRGLGVLLVMLYHLKIGPFPSAWISMSFFFGLSGILMTLKMITVVTKKGVAGLSVLSFWARRVARLLPALLLTVALIAIKNVIDEKVFGVIGTEKSKSILRQDLIWALAYCENFHMMQRDQDYFASFEGPSVVRHIWSLSIEEQYYFLWPLIFLALAKFSEMLSHRSPPRTFNEPPNDEQRGLVRILVLFEVAAMVLSQFMGVHVLEAHGGSTAYFATWTRAGEFAVGGLVACSMNLLPLVRHRVLRIGDIQDVPPLTFGQRIGLEVGVGLYFFVAVGSCMIPLPVETLIWHCFHWFRLPLLSAILGFAVCSTVQLSEPLPRWAIFTNMLTSPTLVFLGTTSYGSYLVHWPLVCWFGNSASGSRDPGFVPAMRDLLILLASIALGGASFFAFELPVMRIALKKTPKTVLLSGLIATIMMMSFVLSATSNLDPHIGSFVWRDGQIRQDTLAGNWQNASEPSIEFVGSKSEPFSCESTGIIDETGISMMFLGDSQARMQGTFMLKISDDLKEGRCAFSTITNHTCDVPWNSRCGATNDPKVINWCHSKKRDSGKLPLIAFPPVMSIVNGASQGESVIRYFSSSDCEYCIKPFKSSIDSSAKFATSIQLRDLRHKEIMKRRPSYVYVQDGSFMRDWEISGTVLEPHFLKILDKSMGIALERFFHFVASNGCHHVFLATTTPFSFAFSNKERWSDFDRDFHHSSYRRSKLVRLASKQERVFDLAILKNRCNMNPHLNASNDEGELRLNVSVLHYHKLICPGYDSFDESINRTAVHVKEEAGKICNNSAHGFSTLLRDKNHYGETPTLEPIGKWLASQMMEMIAMGIADGDPVGNCGSEAACYGRLSPCRKAEYPPDKTQNIRELVKTTEVCIPSNLIAQNEM